MQSDHIFAISDHLNIQIWSYNMMVDKLRPAAFEKHSEKETSRNYVWVFTEGVKVTIWKTVLLAYYNIGDWRDREWIKTTDFN